jgi:hypothetical protein
MRYLTQVGTSVLTLVVICAKLAHMLFTYSSVDVREDDSLASEPRYLKAR